MRMSKARKGTGAKVDGVLHLELSARFAMEPASRMIAYNGRIVLETDEGDYRVGYVKYHALRVSEMLGSGSDAILELDAEDADTADYCEFINDQQDGWSNEVLAVWPEAPFEVLVVLSRLVVYPPFRGQEIGLLCLGTLRGLIGGMCLFVMRPMPKGLALRRDEGRGARGGLAVAAGEQEGRRIPLTGYTTVVVLPQ